MVPIYICIESGNLYWVEYLGQTTCNGMQLLAVLFTAGCHHHALRQLRSATFGMLDKYSNALKLNTSFMQTCLQRKVRQKQF